MRRVTRRALVVGLTLAGMAVSEARADVRTINLDTCSGSCIAPATDDSATAESDAAADVTLSLFGGGGTDDPNDSRAALKLDGSAMPTVLISGLPSPIASAGAPVKEARGVSPYDFFEEVIDIPLPVDARNGISAASILLFAPSLIGRLTLTDVLSNSNALFGRRARPAM